nr:condensation domain-containing protein [uncultured Methanospirillum sp.]
MYNTSHQPDSKERYQVNAFDLTTDLFCTFSYQVIHLVIDLDSKIRYEILNKAVDRATLAHPIVRCRIIRDQDTLFWQECSDFCINNHIHRLSSSNPANLLHHALSYPLDPDRGILFTIVIIENSDKTRGILVITVHHIVMDARGLKDFSGLIMRLYEEYQSGPMSEISVSAIRSRELPRFSSITQPVERDSHNGDIGWCSPITIPLQSLHADNFQYSILTFDQSRASIIHDTRKRWGITVNDLMIAVLSRAIFSATCARSEISVPMYTTIDLRRYLPVIPERSLLNVSTAFEVQIPVQPGESLEETGKRVNIIMNRIKSQNPGIKEAVEAETLADTGYDAARKIIDAAWKNISNAGRKTTIFSNTGIFTHGQIGPGSLSVRNAYFLPGFFQPPGFFFILSTFDDIMTLSASYAIPAYDQDLVDRIFLWIEHDIPGFNDCKGDYKIIT